MISAAASSECDQDKAAIVEFKNETSSRLEFLLGLSPPPLLSRFDFSGGGVWKYNFSLFSPTPLIFFPAAPKAGCHSIPPGQREN